MYLELAAVAGTGVHVTYAQRATEDVADPLLQFFADAQRGVARGRGFGDDAGAADGVERLQHAQRSWPL
jgi:hypothetical protein